MSREEANRLLNLLRALEQQDEASEFLSPVDYKALGLDDYPLIIKTPMDLSLVKKNLKAGLYEDVSDVLADIQLIWDNCRTYNMSDSIFVQQAEAMEHHVKRICQKLKIPYEFSMRRREVSDMTAQRNEVSYEEKMNLRSRLNAFSPELLLRLVDIVKMDCPRALTTLEDERVAVNLDLIDKQAYSRLIQLQESEPDPVKRQKLE